jgi:hypothetical protein
MIAELLIFDNIENFGIEFLRSRKSLIINWSRGLCERNMMVANEEEQDVMLRKRLRDGGILTRLEHEI